MHEKTRHLVSFSAARSALPSVQLFLPLLLSAPMQLHIIQPPATGAHTSNIIRIHCAEPCDFCRTPRTENLTHLAQHKVPPSVRLSARLAPSFFFFFLHLINLKTRIIWQYACFFQNPHLRVGYDRFYDSPRATFSCFKKKLTFDEERVSGSSHAVQSDVKPTQTP